MGATTTPYHPKVRIAQGQLTTAQVNSGTVVVTAQAGKTIKVVDFWLRAIGGSAATATSVDITDTNSSPVTACSWAVGAITQNTVARAGAASVTATNLGTSLTKGKGLQIGRTVNPLTTCTDGVDYVVLYKVDSD